MTTKRTTSLDAALARLAEVEGQRDRYAGQAQALWLEMFALLADLPEPRANQLRRGLGLLSSAEPIYPPIQLKKD